jgi:hypothetical protein
MTRYGQPSFGHAVPVPPEPHDKAVVTQLLARHLEDAVVRDTQGIAHRMPADFDFTVHTMTLTDGRQFYAALYSGEGDPMPRLLAAPVAGPTDPADAHPGTWAEGNAGSAPEVSPDPANRWDWAPGGAHVVSDSAHPGWDSGLPLPAPELDKPVPVSQSRRW